MESFETFDIEEDDDDEDIINESYINDILEDLE